LDMVITTSKRHDFLYPLTGEGNGLYLYLALDRDKGNIPLSRRCLVEINNNLRL